MLDIKTILVPTDFSEYSDNALRYGCEFAEQFDAELHVLHVLYKFAHATPEKVAAFLPPGDLMLDMKGSAKRNLNKRPDAEWSSRRPVVRAMREGRPFLEIIRYADEFDIDLIIMGTHGWGPISHMLVGSVAEKVVRKAGRPVLTIRHPEHEFVMP